MTVKTFSELLREEISDNYRDKKFSVWDFKELAKSHKRTNKSVADILYTLYNNGQLKIVDKVFKKTATRGSNVYEVIEDADLRLMGCVERKKNFLETGEMKLKKQVEACARLNKALDRMIVNR